MHLVRRIGSVALPAALALSLLTTAAPAEAASDDPGVHDRQVERSKQYYGGSAGFSTPGGFTYRLSVSNPAGRPSSQPPTKVVIRAAARRQGIEPTKIGPVTGYVKRYAKFNARNVRRNLSMRTGYTRVQSDAHHIMPKKFERRFFKPLGINIHHPRNMTWWYRPSHQRYAAKYNREWAKWINRNPNATKSQVLRRAEVMRAKYAHLYGKPGPAGCKPGRCRVAEASGPR